MARTRLYRGPHDGLVLKLKQINRYCHLVGTKNGNEERLFAMMPSLLNWKRVIRGKMPKDGPFDMLYAYELVGTVTGPAFLLRGHDEFVEAAGGL